MKIDNRRSVVIKKLDRYLGIPLVFGAALLRPILRLVFRRAGDGKMRILVIKISALGDAVVMLPALYLLHQTLPEAEIFFLGGSSNESFVKTLPFVAKFEAFSKKSVSNLRRYHYAAVIDFDQWVRATALFSVFFSSKNTSGFRSQGQHRHFAYDLQLRFDKTMHMAENFWHLAAATLRRLKRIPKSQFVEDRGAVQRTLAPTLSPLTNKIQGDYVIFHPGCGEHGSPREWPQDRWVQLVQDFKTQRPGVSVFVTGQGDYEMALSRPLVDAGAISAVNDLSFLDLCGALAGAQGVVTGNTGIMHLASFLNENVVVINGPTDPRLWGPLWGGRLIASTLKCAPCLTWGNDYGCSDPVCTKVITPAQILGEVSA